MPPEPDIDPVCVEILGAYAAISRRRQYVGLAGAPAPLSHADIDGYLRRFPTAINRDEFDAAIFALDDECRAQWAADNPPPDTKPPKK